MTNVHIFTSLPTLAFLKTLYLSHPNVPYREIQLILLTPLYLILKLKSYALDTVMHILKVFKTLLKVSLARQRLSELLLALPSSV